MATNQTMLKNITDITPVPTPSFAIVNGTTKGNNIVPSKGVTATNQRIIEISL